MVYFVENGIVNLETNDDSVNTTAITPAHIIMNGQQVADMGINDLLNAWLSISACHCNSYWTTVSIVETHWAACALAFDCQCTKDNKQMVWFVQQ